MKLYIGADHAGFAMKEILRPWLESLGHEVVDCGDAKLDPADDYPDYIFPVAHAVAAEAGSKGIVLGGSGQGEGMAANRVKGARAFVFYGPRAPQAAVDAEGHLSHDPYEIVRLSREHNDANVFSIGARFVTQEEAQTALQIWLDTHFSGIEHHQKRVIELDEA